MRQESDAVSLVVLMSAQPAGHGTLGMWPSADLAASSLTQDCITPITAHWLVLWNRLSACLFELCIVMRCEDF